MTAWQTVGSRSRRPSVRRRGWSARRGTARRKMIWQPATFSPNTLASNSVVELAIATQTDLMDLTLGKGTIGMIYGEICIVPEENQTTLDQCTGAWGIRLKEADATTTTTAFAPMADGDSSDWMHWQAFSIWKQFAGTQPVSGNPSTFHFEKFLIRNPRKVEPEQELVAVLQTSAPSNDIRYFFWCRAALIQP